MAISISIKRKRIFILASIAISRNKSTRTRIVVSRPQINSSRFLVIVFTTITVYISIRIINILFNTESVILVSFCNLTCFICKIYNIAMSVLGIVGVFRLCTVAEIVLCNKICATDIAVSFIELVVNNICNNLLASVPDMVNCLTVNSLFIAQTACIVLVACSCCAVGKANKLI